MASVKEDGYDYMFKIVVVGDSGVGKTNLITRFTRNQFDHCSANTIGVEFTSKSISIGGKIVKAQLWDTAGQERYRAVSTAYYRSSMGGLLVYDITKKASFDQLPRWLDDMRQQMPDADILLVGNKTDLRHLREVTEEEGATFGKENGLQFIETSAMNADNVEQAFLQLLNDVYKRQSQYATKSKSANDGIRIPIIDPTSSKSTSKNFLSCCKN